MNNPRDNVDPQWAWSPYRPSDDHSWTRRLAAHLFRRAGFCASWSELDEAVKLGPAACVDRLCNPAAAAPDVDRSMETLADRAAETGNPHQLSAWWLYRMLNTADPLMEKLTLFWHGHFATSARKVDNARLMLEQNELLRRSARGPFETLVRAISRDPAMLIYLDSTTNRRIHPNENYARELMELFCLGVGNYTERDIKEVARAFTGWEVRSEHFEFNRPQHDTHDKTFLGHTGNFDGDDAVRIILDQPAAPRFIARKLVRFFVFDEPAAPEALIEPLAQELRENGFRTAPVVRRMLSSNLFFSEHAIGRKVRSPVDLGVGLLRALGATTNLVTLAHGLDELGQALFYPPNVKGWDGGRAWINSSTLLGRPNLVREVLTASETRYDRVGGSLGAAAQQANAKTPQQIVDWLLELLVAVPVPAESKSVLVKLMQSQNADPSAGIAKVIHAISAFPEFQLA